MFGREAPDRRIVDADTRHIGLAGHPAHQHHRDWHLRPLALRPGAVGSDLRDSPDDAVDLASAKSIEQLVHVARLGFQDQVEGDPVTHLGRLPFDGCYDARRAEELEPVGDDAQNVAPTLGQASGQHVGCVPGLLDDGLNPPESLRRHIGTVVEDARNGLDRDPRFGRHLSDRKAFPLGH